MATRQDQGKSSTGMDASVAAALSYLVGFISGLIFFLIEKQNKFVRFHALQSVIISLTFAVLSIALSFVPALTLASPLLALVQLVLWVVTMVKAYQGVLFKLPIAGDIAEKNA